MPQMPGTWAYPKMNWKSVKDSPPQEPDNYLCFWRYPPIPKDGTQILHVEVLFYRTEDKRWLDHEHKSATPEYWTEIEMPEGYQ